MNAIHQLETLKALIEADLAIPTKDQLIFHNGAPCSDASKTLGSYGIRQDDILLVTRNAKRPRSGNSSSTPAAGASSSTAGNRNPTAQAEAFRQELLNNPALLANLSQVLSPLSLIYLIYKQSNQILLPQSSPQLASAALNNPQEFVRLILDIERQKREAQDSRQREMMALEMADPFDMDAQAKIAEAIRLQNVQQNMEHALEYHPEAFGRVTMLYIDVEVNGIPVKAFVDSGAQATILSPDCAEATGLTRLLDTRFQGVAHGVGTAKILGRVHSAPMKVGKHFLPCSFTVMEGKGVDLLFGLDMLKRHQAVIDLSKNVLRINEEEVPFLSEHELPLKARMEMGEGEEEDTGKNKTTTTSTTAPSSSSSTTKPAATSSSSSSSSAPAPTPSTSTKPPTQSTSSPSKPKYSEETIATITALGISRAEAIAALDAANGNPDVAASLLFN